MAAQPGHHIGREMISNVIEQVGIKNIKTIRAEFADTNLKAFTGALNNGKSAFESVRNTPFGKAFRDLGLDNALFDVNPTAYPRPSVIYKLQD